MAVQSVILARGTLLDAYRIDDVIGIGGMAVVYRAEHVGLGRPVALKILAPRLSHDEQFRERFRREGKHAATLDHPNVVSVYDSGEADGRLFLAMRLVEGTTLAEQMHVSALPAGDTLGLLRPIAAALDAAHAAGLVHRDVKPENILIGPGGHPYLADFGVAKGLQAGDLTATGGFVGTFNYAAPEQFMDRSVTAATDVYSLCAVLFQCLTGQIPYTRDTDAGVLSAHVTEPPPTVKVTEPADDALNAVLACGMAKEPSQRYHRASDLIAEAAAALGTLSDERRTAAPPFLPNEPDPTRPWAGLADSLAVDLPGADVTRDSAEPGAQTSQVADTEAAEAPSADAADPAGELVAAMHDAASVERRRSMAPLRSERGSRGRTVPLVAAGVVAAVLVGGGVAITLSSTSAPPVRPRTISAGPLSVSYRPPWRTAPVPTALAGLIADPAVLAERTATLLAGPLARSAAIPGALSPPVIARLGHPSTTSETTIAGHPATRYVWTSYTGATVTAILIPTAAEDLALICSAATATTDSGCAPVIASASMHGTTVLAPGPDTALGTALRDALRPLAAVRKTDRLAGPMASRARAAQTIARSDRAAAQRIAASETPARYRTRSTALTSALRQEAGSLAALASAAHSGNRSAYAASAIAVHRAGVRLAAAERAAASAGLRLQPLAPVSDPAAPPLKKRTPARGSTGPSGPTTNDQVTSTPVTDNPGTSTRPLTSPAVTTSTVAKSTATTPTVTKSTVTKSTVSKSTVTTTHPSTTPTATKPPTNSSTPGSQRTTHTSTSSTGPSGSGEQSGSA